MHKQSGPFQKQGSAVETLRSETRIQGQIIEGRLDRASYGASRQAMNCVAARRVFECLEGAGLEHGLTEIIEVMLERDADAQRACLGGGRLGVDFVQGHNSQFMGVCMRRP